MISMQYMMLYRWRKSRVCALSGALSWELLYNISQYFMSEIYLITEWKYVFCSFNLSDDCSNMSCLVSHSRFINCLLQNSKIVFSALLLLMEANAKMKLVICNPVTRFDFYQCLFLKECDFFEESCFSIDSIWHILRPERSRQGVGAGHESSNFAASHYLT